MSDKYDLICGLPIDKVVEIVDDYLKGNLLKAKGTVKMRKGDYVLYKYDWLKEHLDMEYDLLGGKAIPVDWLLTKAQEYLIDMRITGWEMRFIKSLIDDWEKENGSNNKH